MLICQRSLVALAFAAFAIIAFTPAPALAQQPEPLRLTAPAPHVIHVEPVAQAEVQTQTAQGELLDVDARASTLTIKTQAAEMTFRYNDQTKVTGAQKGVSGLATMTGSQATVMYRKEGQINLATAIDIKAAK
jgi:hypothetical protein